MGFLDSFFGSAGGNDDLRWGNDQANNYLDSGLRKYTTLSNETLDNTAQYYQPYIDQGNAAGETYFNALGLNGVDPQQEYYANFQNDPGFQATLDAAQDSLERSSSARGGLFSGRTAQGLFDQAQQAQYGQYQNRLNRLAALSGQGQQAASNYGGLTYKTGMGIADANFGVNQQKAAGVKGLANAVAQSRGSGFQGLLNGVGTAAKMFI